MLRPDVYFRGISASSPAIVRQVERQRAVAARPPHAIIGKQGRQPRAGPQQHEIEESGIARAQLAPRFRHLTDDDLTTSSALLQAVKLA